VSHELASLKFHAMDQDSNFHYYQEVQNFNTAPTETFRSYTSVITTECSYVVTVTAE